MAKSMLHIAIGIADRASELRLDRRIPVPEWIDQDDPRHGITWHHLLHMASGLSWIEEYSTEHGSDVIEMLFGKGADDMAAFAASFPLSAQPGTRFRLLEWHQQHPGPGVAAGARLQGDEGMRAWSGGRAVRPARHDSATPRFDPAGTSLASSVRRRDHPRLRPFGLLTCAVAPGTGTPSSTAVGRPRSHTHQCPPEPRRSLRLALVVHPDDLGTFSAAMATRVSASPASPPETSWWCASASATHPTDRDRDPSPVDVYLDELIACFADCTND